MIENRKKTLLLVEDQAITALSEKMLLEAEGYNVIHVLSGEQAIEMICINKETVDLILMDIDLGKGMDGTEAARRILDSYDIPILFLSSHTEKEIVAKAEAITNYGYVVKDSSFTVLDASIKMTLKLFDVKCQLKERQDFLESVVETTQDGFYVLDANGYFIDANSVYCKMLGYSKDELISLHLSDISSDFTKDKFIERITNVIENGHLRCETKHRKKDGSLIPVEVSICWIKKYGVSTSFCRDISDRIKAQQVFDEKNNILSSLLDNLPLGVFMVEAPSGKPLVANEIAKQLLGRGILPDVNAKSIGEVYQAFMRNSDERYPLEEMPILRGLRGEKTHIDDMDVKKPDGTRSMLEVYGSPVVDKDGNINASLVSFFDISERKMAEQKVINLLLEKEIILKEVNHRMKNNMNTVSSLLKLQSNSQMNEAAKGILRDADARIKSMMVLYDKLYQSENIVALSLKEYLPSLIKEISSIFSKSETVKISTHVEDIILDAKILSTLGIILNELVTNSMKYAFPDKKGVIMVMAVRDRNLVSIEYHDNGIGIPESVGFENTTGFGMQLIKMLTEQIGGAVRIDRGNGTKFVIEFEPR